jgi:predicted metal-binding protein
VAIKEVDYEGHKLYVCTRCRPQWDTFTKAEADAHDKAGEHRNEKGTT